MVARKALASVGCWHCRTAVLRPFTDSTLASLSPITARTTHAHLRYRTLGQPAALTSARSFSSASQNVSESRTSQSQEIQSKGAPPTEPTPVTGDGESKGEADGNVPWYLQVEPPRHVAAMEPAPLPEIPPNSPSLLDPLLKYISEEMGLDDIALLDLRAMDPPPGLGSNLFMLFGTARSERHLVVSSGRLVRWLRAKHRIHADADGLLGPNEKKKKLKRKAKKAKLLGTMGTDDADDGISTGWICVHLGSVGRDKAESPVVAEDGRVAGFGVRQRGSTIVVQVMTEARRHELDLERLWVEALNGPESVPEVGRVGSSSSSSSSSQSSHPLDQAINRTSPTRPTVNERASAHKNQASFYSTIAAEGSSHGIPKDDPLLPSSFEKLAQTLTFDATQKWRVLELLIARLEQMNAPQVRAAFGDRGEEQYQAPFLQLFELAIKNLPAQQTWGYRLALQTKACESQFSGSVSSLADAQNLLEEMRISGITATRAQYLQLVTCIYRTSGAELREQSKMALELLQTMQQRGEGIVANDVIVAIIESKLAATDKASCDDLVTNLQQLRLQADLPCMEEPLLKRLLTVFIKADWWEQAWDTWRMPARYIRPRSPDMYAHIYRLGATTNQGAAIQILRRCFQSMFNEKPPVGLYGEVLDAITACIHQADSTAFEIAANLPETELRGQNQKLANREFVKLVKAVQSLSQQQIQMERLRRKGA